MLTVLASLALLAQASGTVVLSEIMYNPDGQTLGADDDMEWIELCNAGSTEANLAGMMVADRGNQLFLEDFILAPGARAVVCANEEAFRAVYGNTAQTVPWSGEWTKLSNSGDEISIYACDGTVIEYLSFSDTWGADGDGPSLERMDLAGPNDESSWQPSRDYANPTAHENGEAACWGTPGEENSLN